MKNFKKCAAFLMCTFVFINTAFSNLHTVYAENESVTNNTASDTANQTESSSTEAESQTATANTTIPTVPSTWPAPPNINSGSAVLIEATTGTVLYDKNSHERNYPASITKIMTALLGIENCNMDDVITFSHNAVYSINPFEDAHISLDVGEQLTVDQTLHAILMKSANEASYGMAEYVSGSLEAFADLMNKRAKELGALDTHFTNASGLEDENHYTTAYDMAMIGRQCFKSDKFMSIISLPTTYTIPATNMKSESRFFYNRYKLLPGREKEYAYSLGGKPGWTTVSGNTLVSFAEKDGMKLIVCVMKSTLTDIYDDTVNLFEYGFNNYKCINIAQNETQYTVPQATFFNTTSDLFEHTNIDLSIDSSSYIVLPNNVDFSAATSSISYNTESVDEQSETQKIATINYTYEGANVGSADLILTNSKPGIFTFNNKDGETSSDDTGITNKSYLQINIKLIILLVIILVFLIFILTYNFTLINKKRKIKRHRHNKKRHNYYN